MADGKDVLRPKAGISTGRYSCPNVNKTETQALAFNHDDHFYDDENREVNGFFHGRNCTSKEQ